MSIDKAALFNSWLEVEQALGEEETDFAAWAFHAIADGYEPTIDDAAAALVIDTPREIVDLLVDAGIVTMGGDCITGAMGLTTEERPHALDLDGRPLHTWCALDAAGIPAPLGRSGVIESQTADDHSSVHLEYANGAYTPNDVFDIFVPVPNANESVVEEACPAINFYHAGQAPIHPLARALSLDEAVELARLIWPAEPPSAVSEI